MPHHCQCIAVLTEELLILLSRAFLHLNNQVLACGRAAAYTFHASWLPALPGSKPGHKDDSSLRHCIIRAMALLHLCALCLQAPLVLCVLLM